LAKDGRNKVEQIVVDFYFLVQPFNQICNSRGIEDRAHRRLPILAEYMSLIAPVTNDHKLSYLKQHEYLLSHSSGGQSPKSISIG